MTRFELRTTSKREKRLIIVFSDDRRIFATERQVKKRTVAKIQEENLVFPAKSNRILICGCFIFVIKV
ncbi:MAG: hypothetical protein IKA61_00675, partial [Clostridia bacterium]|nr:hypothetical protein [Clostridia bacterium]